MKNITKIFLLTFFLLLNTISCSNTPANDISIEKIMDKAIDIIATEENLNIVFPEETEAQNKIIEDNTQREKDAIPSQEAVNSISQETVPPVTQENYLETITAENATKTGSCGDNITYYFKDNILVLKGSGTMYDYGEYTSPPWNKTWGYHTVINTIVIEEGITNIGAHAFHNNIIEITDIILPPTITKIGDSAFSGSGLVSITIPDSVTSIGAKAFAQNDFITLTIPDSVTEIGAGAFYLCQELKAIQLPKNITSIEDETFKYCSALENITIPNKVTKIGNQAFAMCSSLTQVELPYLLYEIGEQAFQSCKKLCGIELPELLMYIDRNAFEYCESLTSIIIPECVAVIDGYTFYNCKNLSSVKLKTTLSKIQNHAFSGCISLEITIPEKVSEIGSWAFGDVPQVYYSGNAEDKLKNNWGAVKLN